MQELFKKENKENRYTLFTHELFENINFRRSEKNLSALDYDSWLSACFNILKEYEIQQYGMACFTSEVVTINKIETYSLSYEMAKVISSGLTEVAFEVSLDVDYLFKGEQAVRHMMTLHHTYGNTSQNALDFTVPQTELPPVPDTDMISTLDFMEIVNKGRAEWNATNPTEKQKPMLRHSHILRKIRSIEKQRLLSVVDTTYLNYVLEEDGYIDAQGKPSKKFSMSPDYALSLAMTYELHTRDIVQNEMNRLRTVINQYSSLPEVLPIGLDTPAIQPALLGSMYYSISQASASFNMEFDRQRLEQTSKAHSVDHIMFDNMDGTKEPAYRVDVWQCAYNINPIDWNGGLIL
jgi:hypothetical protein